MSDAVKYAFGPHMSAIISDLDRYTANAVCAGWTSVVSDLQQVRHILEGVGATMDGQTLSFEDNDDDGICAFAGGVS